MEFENYIQYHLLERCKCCHVRTVIGPQNQNTSHDLYTSLKVLSVNGVGVIVLYDFLIVNLKFPQLKWLGILILT